MPKSLAEELAEISIRARRNWENRERRKDARIKRNRAKEEQTLIEAAQKSFQEVYTRMLELLDANLEERLKEVAEAGNRQLEYCLSNNYNEGLKLKRCLNYWPEETEIAALPIYQKIREFCLKKGFVINIYNRRKPFGTKLNSYITISF